MNLGDAFFGIIPIDSHTRQRAEAVAPVPVPAAGARIGRPSAFSFSNEGARRSDDRGGDEGSSPSVTVNLPDRGPAEYMRVIRAPAKVSMQEVRVPDPNDATRYVDVERVRFLRFTYVEHPPKPTLGSLQPSVEVSYSLEFALHPVTEDQLREFEAEGSV